MFTCLGEPCPPLVRRRGAAGNLQGGDARLIGGAAVSAANRFMGYGGLV